MNSKGKFSGAKKGHASVQKRKTAISSPRVQPVQLTAGLGDVVPEQSVATIVYNKVATTFFSVKLNEIKIRGDKSRNCYDVAWQVPGFGLLQEPQNGIACHISHTVYTFENLSDFVVYMRLQRPLGYKQDPNAIAMWEPITNKEDLVIPIHPRKMLKFNVSHSANNLLCPRHIVKDGDDYVHLLAMCLFREACNIHGNDSVVSGLGLQVSVDTHYRVNDGNIGKDQSQYLVRAYKNTAHMDVVNAGPVYPVRFMDSTDAKLKHITAQQSGSMFILVGVGTDNRDKYEFNNLDENTMYRLPSGIPIAAVESGFETAYPDAIYDVIKYDPKAVSTGGRWTIGQNITTDRKTITFKNRGTAASSNCPVWAPSEYLRPVAFGAKKSSVTFGFKNVKGISTCIKIPDAHYKAQFGSMEFVETVLKAIVEVVKVVHVVAQFAAALGLLDIKDQQLSDGGDGQVENEIQHA